MHTPRSTIQAQMGFKKLDLISENKEITGDGLPKTSSCSCKQRIPSQISIATARVIIASKFG